MRRQSNSQSRSGKKTEKVFGGKNPNNKDPDLNDLLDKLSVLERDYDNIEKERTVYKLEA